MNQYTKMDLKFAKIKITPAKPTRTETRVILKCSYSENKMWDIGIFTFRTAIIVYFWLVFEIVTRQRRRLSEYNKNWEKKTNPSLPINHHIKFKTMNPQQQQQQQQKLFQFKLVLLGESAVGKSSLVLRFVKGQFHEYQESTIGGAASSTVSFNGV